MWEAPLDTNAPFVRYMVCYTRQGLQEMVCQNTSDLALPLSNLLPFTNYSFQVAAASSAGLGSSTEALTVQTEQDGELGNFLKFWLNEHPVSS